jgi:hypothetical protein
LSDIVKGPGVARQIAASILGPLFQGGALIESYRQQKARGHQAAVRADRATALGEIPNACAAEAEAARVEQVKAVEAYRESRLAILRQWGCRPTTKCSKAAAALPGRPGADRRQPTAGRRAAVARPGGGGRRATGLWKQASAHGV